MIATTKELEPAANFFLRLALSVLDRRPAIEREQTIADRLRAVLNPGAS